ncbi:MAG: flagellar biosynthesis protein FlhF [Betaproteobacteria bacterium]|nr:flagellar biosynthesis protein FlhF [Betaproteobacteria bacterium]
MVVRKFFASNTKEALRMVREALGADALILANRPMPGGVEIMAVAEHEVDAVAARPPATPPEQKSSRPRSDPPAAVHPGDLAVTQELLEEVRTLRGMVEGQLAGFAWRELAASSPVQAEVVKEMLVRGFGAGFARALAAQVPAGQTFAQAIRWIKAALINSLKCVPAGQDIVNRGGVYALVGPTGVGKTTTVAKLAASCTLQHGPSQVALVTTDTYRIGAVDQLRIYGKILGVPVYAAKDEDDLKVTLAELHGRRLVLIDTVGMGQRDRRVAEQVALLSGHGKPVDRLLLLSAVSQGETLEDVLRNYRGEGLSGCILTKVDEALSLGGAIDVVMRSGLPLHYVANGQRVPEDIHLANAMYLVERAFRSEVRGSGFRPAAEEIPLLIAARSPAVTSAPGA